MIENEANAGAYREYQTRPDADESLVYISIGTGIGAGIVLNGSLYRGQSGYAGEIGHMTLDFQGPRCTCGNSGCLELYASEPHLFISGCGFCAGTMPSIATISLFYAVTYWNTYMTAILYINDSSKWPIQVLLRQIVIVSSGMQAEGSSVDVVPPAGLNSHLNLLD